MTDRSAAAEIPGPSTSAQNASPQWWWPLRVYARHLLLAGLPAAMFIALLGYLKEPQFESRAVVEVQAPVFASASQHSRVAGSLPLLMETQKNIVASTAVAGDPTGNLRVEVVPQTFLLALYYKATDAEAARSGANAVAQAYVDFTVNAQVQEVRRAAALLIAKLDSITRVADFSTTDVGDSEPALAALSADPVNDLIPPLQMGDADTRALSGLASTSQRMLGPVLESALVSQLVSSYDATLAQMISARILEPAILPQAPAETALGWWVLLGYLGTVAVPALVLAARFQWRDTLDFQADIPRMLGRSCVGVLPLAPAVQLEEFLADRPFAHALAALRTQLQLSGPEPDPLEQFPKGRMLLVTSSQRGEGKSTVAGALALALAMGHTERVLLINLDMRASREFLGLPARAPGLSHLIAGAAQLRDCIHRPQGKGIDVIPAGVLPPNPQALLASKRLRRILEMLQRRYDTVILDAPALGEVNDTLIVARQCTAIMVVLAAGSTSAAQARSELQKLDNPELPATLLVLNRTQEYESAALPLWRGNR